MKKKCVYVSLAPDGIKLKGKVYVFSKGFLMFLINKDVTERDIKGEENKIKQFLKDIVCKQIGDTKSNRSKIFEESWLVSVNLLLRLYQDQPPVKMK